MYSKDIFKVKFYIVYIHDVNWIGST